MRNETFFESGNTISLEREIINAGDYSYSHGSTFPLPEILFISSYPPRECGIATFSQDLIKALNNKFDHSFKIKICALDTNTEKPIYSDEIKYKLNTEESEDFVQLAKKINQEESIQMVMIQHEFGLFAKKELEFKRFLKILHKPIILTFHTVLPSPNESLRNNVQAIAALCESVIVMTHTSAKILVEDYALDQEKITIIPHGTHLVPHLDKAQLKEKYNLSGKKVLATFGLLSSGKSIETTLNALPTIIKNDEDILFLIIGKTHPSVVKSEGEKYRNMLESKVESLNLQKYVRFVNTFLPLTTLLEYLQLTDIYLFTSKDPNQAVSGTFSYAFSCGCPVISTPIPHAKEVLKNDAGIIIDFENSTQLAKEVKNLLDNEKLRNEISLRGLHTMAPTAWENAAIAHAQLFENHGKGKISLHYKIPEVNLDYVKKLTTDFGIIQFSILNQPDIDSGYTLDDNARAMVAFCQHFQLTKESDDLKYIAIYLNFINFCLQSNGSFLNYVNEEKEFVPQNYETNLADSNGRAIWSLGYLISIGDILPFELAMQAEIILQRALENVREIHSSRAMAFIIKGLYYRSTKNKIERDKNLITLFADRLVQMFRHVSDDDWTWFESYLTYGNSILPEAMLCASLATGNPIYKQIAKSSFDFLLSKIFDENQIKVISNKGWLHKGEESNRVIIGGEQPIDIAYTILALGKFYAVFNKDDYKQKMEIAFNWFLGNNHLSQIIYNPCTGGCYDGLEENSTNLNQGAESTVSYLMARLTIEQYETGSHKNGVPLKNFLRHFRKNQMT